MIVVDPMTFDLVTINVSTAFGAFRDGATAAIVTVGMGSDRQLHPAIMFLMANASNAAGRATLIAGAAIAGAGDLLNLARSWSSIDRFRFGVTAVPTVHEDGIGPGLEVLCQSLWSIMSIAGRNWGYTQTHVLTVRVVHIVLVARATPILDGFATVLSLS